MKKNNIREFYKDFMEKFLDNMTARGLLSTIEETDDVSIFFVELAKYLKSAVKNPHKMYSKVVYAYFYSKAYFNGKAPRI